jgi:integrase
MSKESPVADEERTRKANLDSTISEVPNPRGYFEAKVWMGTKANGKPDRRHIQRKTLAGVRKRVRELERERDAGKVTKPGRPPTVREMLERHLSVTLPARGTAPRTIDSYRSVCRTHIYPLWGGQRIDRLLPEHIEEGVAQMLVAGLARSTVRKAHAILSSAYEIQVGRGNVARNPCKLVQPPKPPQSEHSRLTQPEVRAVVAAAASRPNGARWAVGLAVGLRQGEALGLTWQRTNLETGRLDIRAQVQRLLWQHGCADAAACAEGKHRRPCPKRCPRKARRSGRPHQCIPEDASNLCPGDCQGHASTCPKRRGGGLVFREIKEQRRKLVRLPDELVSVLKEHRDAQYLQRLTADREWNDHDLVFCQWNGNPIDPRRDWGEWCDILKAAGLPHYRLHAMRHSTASIALEKGIAIAVVQEMLGHSDIRVTRSYTHVSEALHDDAARRIGEVFTRDSE